MSGSDGNDQGFRPVSNEIRVFGCREKKEKKRGGGTKKGNGFDNIKLKDLMCMIQGITTARMMVISSKMSGE